MSILRKFLNFGCENPLALSMGHPVKDRVKRLGHTKSIRGGGVAAALLIGGGLALTSVAKENLLSFSEHAPLFTSDKGVTIQGVPFVISYMAAEDLQPVLEYKIQGNAMMTTYQPLGHNLLEGATVGGFPPMPFLDACIDHVFKENTKPIWYARTGKILKIDADDKAYIVACMPGTAPQHKNLSVDDLVKSVNKSASLSAQEKQALIADIRTRGGFSSFANRTRFVDQTQFIAMVEQTPHLSEQQKQEMIKSIGSGHAKFTVSSTSAPSQGMYKIDPNLSKAQRKALTERMSSISLGDSLVISSDMSEAEQQKKKQEWQARTDARMAQKGFIKVDPEEQDDFLAQFED